ncbi:MAG: hypothetical protein J7L88_01455, partial [Thermoplasmata archaeon]|nr:hypothetical protein [Thermoplasmata archaeon]
MMWRRVIIVFLLFAFMFGVFGGVGVFDVIKGGDRNIVSGEGSTYDTVIWIHNVYELQNMSKNLAGHYELANDIDASVTKTWNGGSGFAPIGTLASPFKGIFDGRGHKIINLYINRPSQSHVGLFGYISRNAVIENVGLVNVNVSGDRYVGELVGENYWGRVNNSYAMGNVSGNMFVGGLVGWNEGTVKNSHYNVSKVLINGGHYLTIGGLFDYQYTD